MSKTINNQAATTLGGGAQNFIPYHDDHNFAWSVEADAVLQKGTSVYLKADGQVAAVSANGEAPLGVVTIPNDAVGGRVTVLIQAKMIVIAIASGAVSTGDRVRGNGVDGTTGRPLYTVDAGAVLANGIALEDAADTEDVTVVIL